MIKLYLVVLLLCACRDYAATTASNDGSDRPYLTMEGGSIAVKNAAGKLLPTAIHEIIPLNSGNLKVSLRDEKKHFYVPFYFFKGTAFKSILFSFKNGTKVSTCILEREQIMKKTYIDSSSCTKADSDVLVKFIQTCRQQEGSRFVGTYDDYQTDEVIWARLRDSEHFACVFERGTEKNIAIPSYCFEQPNLGAIMTYMGHTNVDTIMRSLFKNIVPKAEAKLKDDKYAKCSVPAREGKMHDMYFFSLQAAEDSSDVITRKTLLKDIQVSFVYKIGSRPDFSKDETPTPMVTDDWLKGGPFKVDVLCADGENEAIIIESDSFESPLNKTLFEVATACLKEKSRDKATLEDLGKLNVYVSYEGDETHEYEDSEGKTRTYKPWAAKFILNPRDMIAAPGKDEVSWCARHDVSWTAHSPCRVEHNSAKNDSSHYITIRRVSSP